MSLNEGLILAAALGSGLIAGFFFSFSFTIMGALAKIPSVQGINAMNAINVVVLNPWFFSAFFGTAALGLVLIALNLTSPPIVTAGAIYILGVIVVTMRCNVPMNTALAKVEPESEAGAALWRLYVRDWTTWNHVRTIAPLISCALYIFALIV